MDFKVFKQAVAKQFELLSRHELFRVDVEKDLLWSTYIESFPAGTNPIFRERREYDCSCCRQYIRAIGDVVAIIDGRIVSLWDVVMEESAYQTVTDALARIVKTRPIANVFLHTEPVAGTDRNFEQLTDRVVTYNHFFANLPAKCIVQGIDIGPKLSERHAQHDVLLRSLKELTLDSVETVLDLIRQGSLYRGSEHHTTLTLFQRLQQEFGQLTDDGARDVFVWSRLKDLPGSVTKIRNTSIGTLLVDLSEGLDLEAAVRKFEMVVAPTNYKRPTALVTPKMIAAAKQTLEELGLVSALERRYARLTDINVNNILFADRSARKSLTGDVFDTLATRALSSRSFERVEEVPIETFISEILPRAESVEIMVENRHIQNLVSLVAPADPTANRLFKWDNGFSWSYTGDVADSIKERVKQAGGTVTGDLCCRLAWSNFDDLDFHMREPTDYEIYFGNKRTLSACGGMLDVDMNAGSGHTRAPVENIFYTDRSRMKEGLYQLFVRQYRQRETIDIGFEVELDYLGAIHQFAYEKAVRQDTDVLVAKLNYSRKNGIEIMESLPSTQISQTAWGLKTQQFQRVNVVMLSPNYWSEHPIGNKHYFFMLDGCANDGQARGFYNEFLKEELNAHRKVIEMVGAKMRTEESTEQLSGLGFSSTQRNEVLAKISGSFTRTVKIVF
jgi:hypothetical protein